MRTIFERKLVQTIRFNQRNLTVTRVITPSDKIDYTINEDNNTVTVVIGEDNRHVVKLSDIDNINENVINIMPTGPMLTLCNANGLGYEVLKFGHRGVDDKDKTLISKELFFTNRNNIDGIVHLEYDYKYSHKGYNMVSILDTKRFLKYVFDLDTIDEYINFIIRIM